MVFYPTRIELSKPNPVSVVLALWQAWIYGQRNQADNFVLG